MASTLGPQPPLEVLQGDIHYFTGGSIVKHLIGKFNQAPEPRGPAAGGTAPTPAGAASAAAAEAAEEAAAATEAGRVSN